MHVRIRTVQHAVRCKYRTQKIAKSSPSGHHDTNLLGCIFVTKACIDNQKELLNNIPAHVPRYGELRLTNGWDRFTNLGHPNTIWRTYLNGFRVLPSLLQRRRSREANQIARCLAVSSSGTLYIHIRGLLFPDGILPGAKFTLHPSLALSYISSVTARHSRSGRQPVSALWHKEWNYVTSAEGATYIRLVSTKFSRPRHELMLREVLPELSTICTAFSV